MITSGTQPVGKRAPIFFGWWIVAASIVGLSTNPGQFAFGSLGLFIIPLGDEFGWNRAEISLAATVFTFTLAFSLPVIGRIVDIVGSRRVLVPSILTFGALLAAIPSFTSELWHLYAIFILIGTLGAGSNALPFMRTLSAWFNRRRGLALGIAMAGGGLGYAYVPPLVQFLIDNYGWRSGYYCLAALTICISAPIVFLFARESPQEMGLAPDGDEAAHESAVHAAQSGFTRAEALRSRAFWLLAFVFCTMTFCMFGMLAHLVPMLVDRGMPTSEAALAASALGMMIVKRRRHVGLSPVTSILHRWVGSTCNGGKQPTGLYGSVNRPACRGVLKCRCGRDQYARSRRSLNSMRRHLPICSGRRPVCVRASALGGCDQSY